MAGPAWEGDWVEVTGLRLHRVRAGAGRPVLLIHGFGGWSFSWRYTVPALSERYEVHALDLKGFGLSEKPPGPVYAPTEQAALVDAYLQQYIGRPAALVGHSLGGLIALGTAVWAPERAAALVLVDAASPETAWPAMRLLRLMRWRGVGRWLARRTVFSPRAVRRFLQGAYRDSQAVTSETVAGYARPFTDPAAYRALLGMIDSPLGAALDPAQVRVPTLLIWGAHDHAMPLSIGRWYAERIPGARLEVLAEVGHVPPEEAPAAFNRILVEFLESCRPPQWSAR